MKVKTTFGEFELLNYHCVNNGNQLIKPHEGFVKVDFKDGTSGIIAKRKVLNWIELPEQIKN